MGNKWKASIILFIILFLGFVFIMIHNRKGLAPPYPSLISIESTSSISQSINPLPVIEEVPTTQSFSKETLTETKPTDAKKQLKVVDPWDGKRRETLKDKLYIDFIFPEILSQGKAENVVITPDGMELAKDEHGKYYSRGSFESDSIPLNFATNASSIAWIQNTPEGTKVTYEISFSKDGKEWGQWWLVFPHDDLNPAPEFREDGSFNPFFGYTIGTLVTHGLDRYPYIRYRITLETQSPDNTPQINSIIIPYYDTTLSE